MTSTLDRTLREATVPVTAAATRPLPLVVYAIAIFSSAFLVFQVQPLIAKFILPWFGGTAAVWSTTMLFFQVMLLGGYAYAYLIVSRLSPRRQGLVHLALMLAALLALPIIPSDAWKPAGGENPTWRILLVLIATVGPPYFLLSSTGPLLQGWFASAHPGRSPYRLYAVSNVGSLLALLSYPLIFERYLHLEVQAWMWSAGYALFVVIAGLFAWRLLRGLDHGVHPPEAEAPSVPPAEEAPGSRSPGVGRTAFWVALAAVASMMLLATTNQMTQDVVSVPLLWVLPLSIYLLTFVIAFGKEHWYRPDWYPRLLMVALLVGAIGALAGTAVPLLWQLLIYSVTLFVACFALHAELVRLKPAPERLTGFYLAVSAGGALGGAFVALLAPALFNGTWEYQLAVVATALLIGGRVVRDYLDARATAGASTRLPRARAIFVATATLGLAAILVSDVGLRSAHAIAMDRNFYGVLSLSEQAVDDPLSHEVVLSHGRIVHGTQFQAPERRGLPTTYFGGGSGIGVALAAHPERDVRPLRIGVVGLGAGTIAASARSGDYLRFYEINPMVLDFADEYFTYLGDAVDRGVDLDTYLGDARLTMERQAEVGAFEDFDILVIDAFSGDAIPAHLLTVEAFALYWRHLKPDGVLAVHVSNRFLDLTPVVRGIAGETGRQTRWVLGLGEAPGETSSNWVLVTTNEAFLAAPVVQQASTPWPQGSAKRVLWTDDYSSLFAVLR